VIIVSFKTQVVFADHSPQVDNTDQIHRQKMPLLRVERSPQGNKVGRRIQLGGRGRHNAVWRDTQKMPVSEYIKTRFVPFPVEYPARVNS